MWNRIEQVQNDMINQWKHTKGWMQLKKKNKKGVWIKLNEMLWCCCYFNFFILSSLHIHKHIYREQKIATSTLHRQRFSKSNERN